MTEFEFAKLIETADLTGGTVIYDKIKVVVVAKSILTHPNCLGESNFLFLIDKTTNIRVGGVMDLGDDIQVYVKPAYRGQGYTSHIMREIVPYWMPGLISVTSFFEYQDAKIEYLAACAQLSLRPKNISSQEHYALWRAMDKKEEEVLASSEYARAIKAAQHNLNLLRECQDKVTKPRRLRKNYGTPDAEFAEDLVRYTRINCQTGDIALPKTNFTSIDFKTASAEEVYITMHRLCATEVNDDFDTAVVDIIPYDDTILCTFQDMWMAQFTLHCISLRSDSICVSIYAAFKSAHEWVQQNTQLDWQHRKNLENWEELSFDWGSLYVDDDYMEFTFPRNWQENTISNLIQKYSIT